MVRNPVERIRLHTDESLIAVYLRYHHSKLFLCIVGWVKVCQPPITRRGGIQRFFCRYVAPCGIDAYHTVPAHNPSAGVSEPLNEGKHAFWSSIMHAIVPSRSMQSFMENMHVHVDNRHRYRHPMPYGMH